MNLAPNSMTVLAASGGFGWLDLAVGVAVLAGIFIFGLFGDRLVGAIVVGVVELLVAVARLIARTARRPAVRRSASHSAPRMPQPSARSRPSAASHELRSSEFGEDSTFVFTLPERPA